MFENKIIIAFRDEKKSWGSDLLVQNVYSEDIYEAKFLVPDWGIQSTRAQCKKRLAIFPSPAGMSLTKLRNIAVVAPARQTVSHSHGLRIWPLVSVPMTRYVSNMASNAEKNRKSRERRNSSRRKMCHRTNEYGKAEYSKEKEDHLQQPNSQSLTGGIKLTPAQGCVNCLLAYVA